MFSRFKIKRINNFKKKHKVTNERKNIISKIERKNNTRDKFNKEKNIQIEWQELKTRKKQKTTIKTHKNSEKLNTHKYNEKQIRQIFVSKMITKQNRTQNLKK